MYKYKAMSTLARMIRAGEVSSDVKIRKALKLFGEYERKSIYQPNTSWKPRFYNRALSANTRARKYGATGKLTADDLEVVYKAYKGVCAKCGTNRHLVFDHIVPFFRGGSNEPSNLQLLCRICNMVKGVA